MAYGISGVVEDEGVPLSGATVVLMDRGTVPRVLQRQVTDGSGNYKFTGLDSGALYTVAAYDPAGGTDYNALVWDKVAPVSMALTDPSWENVVLLVGNDNGANASTTFVDYSMRRNQVTTFGDAQWSNTTAPTGLTTSMKFDGTADKLLVWPNASVASLFDLANYDFTVELYWYHSVSTDQILWDTREVTSGGATGHAFGGVGTTGLRIGWGGSNRITTANPGQSAWHHSAWTCASGGSVTQWSNGTSVGTAARSMASGPNGFSIGSDGSNFSPGGPWNGYIAAVRVTIGTVRYTGTFTPPTLPLPTN